MGRQEGACLEHDVYLLLVQDVICCHPLKLLFVDKSIPIDIEDPDKRDNDVIH